MDIPPYIILRQKRKEDLQYSEVDVLHSFSSVCKGLGTWSIKPHSFKICIHMYPSILINEIIAEGTSRLAMCRFLDSSSGSSSSLSLV